MIPAKVENHCFTVRLGIASTHGREKGLTPESLAHAAVSLQISPAFGQQLPNRYKNSSSKTGNDLQERDSQPPPISILPFLLSNRSRTLACGWLGLSASLVARCGRGFSSCQQDLRTSSDQRVWGSAPSSRLMSGRPTSWLYF